MAEIFYCDMCGARVTEGDLEQGRGVRVGTSCFCRKCAPKATEQLTGRQVAKSEKHITKSEKPITKHTRQIQVSAPASGGIGLIIVILALMAVAVLVAVFVLPRLGEDSGAGVPTTRTSETRVQPPGTNAPPSTTVPAVSTVPVRPPLGEGRPSVPPENVASPPPTVTTTPPVVTTPPAITPSPVVTTPPAIPPLKVATVAPALQGGEPSRPAGTGKVIFTCDFENGAKDWIRGKLTTEIVPPGSKQAFKADFFDNSAWSICPTYWQEKLFILGENTYFQFDYLAQNLDREDAKVLFGQDAPPLIFSMHFSVVSDGKWHTQRFRINDSQPEESQGKAIVPGLVVDGIKFFAGRSGRKDALFVVDNIIVEDFVLPKTEVLCSWDFENGAEGWQLNKNDEGQPCNFASVIALPNGNHVLQAGEGSQTSYGTRRLEAYGWLFKPAKPYIFMSGKDVRIEMDYYVEGLVDESEFYLVTFAGISPRFNYRYNLPFLGNGKWAHASVCVADMKRLETKTLIPDGVPTGEIKIWAYSPSPSVTLMIDNLKVTKGQTSSAASVDSVTQTSKPAPEVRPAPPPDPAKALYVEARSQYSQRLIQRDYAGAKVSIEEMLTDPKYAPAAGLLRSDIEDLALLTEFIDRSAANVQKFVGKAIDAGGVSFKVVAVKGNEITTSVRGGQVVQPITRLKSDELMYLYNASPHTDSDKAAACRMVFYLAEGRTGDAKRVLLGQLKGETAEKYAAKLQALSEGNTAP